MQAFAIALVSATLFFLPSIAIFLPVNQADKSSSFDIVAVHPDGPGDHGWHMFFTSDGFSASGVTLEMMVEEASGQYDRTHVIGGASWVRSQRFTVIAKDTIDPNIFRRLSVSERRAILLAALTDRFHLKLSHQSKLLPALGLEIAKNGAKFKASEPDHTQSLYKGVVLVSLPGNLKVQGFSLNGFATLLQPILGQPVVDQTNLNGTYDMALKWSPDSQAQRAEAASNGSSPLTSVDSGPTIYTALQDQLGLKLRPIKSAQDIVVIERAEMPSPN